MCWDGQECDSSPAVADMKVVLTWSFWIISLYQMDSHSSVRTLVDLLRLAFNSSAWVESMHGAFPLVKALMEFLASAAVGVWYRC